MAIIRGTLSAADPKRVTVAGSFGAEVVGNKASVTGSVASGESVFFYADASGAQGNGLSVSGTADGSAKASLDLGTVTTNIDTVLEATTGGTAGNDIAVTLTGSNAASGVVITVDASNSHVVVAFDPDDTTVADLETAIGNLAGADDIIAVKTSGTGTNTLTTDDLLVGESLVGGTAADYVVWATEPPSLEFHFTPGASTSASIAAVVNAADDDKMMSMAVVTGTDVWQTGDAFAAEALTSDARNRTEGYGFSASNTAVGTYVVTFDDAFVRLESVSASVQHTTANDLSVLVGPVDLSAKTLTLFVVDNDGALAQFDQGDNNKVNFRVVFKNTTA